MLALPSNELFKHHSACKIMATHTIQKPFVKPHRTHDYLYDPNFTVSSNRDHSQESYKAQSSVEKIRHVPNFKTMFSCLRHHPSQRITLDMTDPVPQHVPRHWRGYADQARSTLIRYKRFNYDPNVVVPDKHYPVTDVHGVDRHKFFKRPIIPFLPQMPPSIVIAPQQLQTDRGDDTSDGLSLLPPPTKSVYVQTDYRDSETQTDPYSPEYVIQPGTAPELLTLASLCYGRGLPAGLAQVEIIERARAKREWEKRLPKLGDESQTEKRRRMMEEQERLEWSYREQEMEAIQEERLQLLKRMLQQRESDYGAINDKRIEHFWSKKQKEKERQIRRVRSDHVKALRKLIEKRKNVEGKKEKRNIIRDYTKYDSQVYAPMTRIGVYLDATADKYTVRNSYNTTLHGILDLESTLKDSDVYLTTKPPNPNYKAVGDKARKKAKLGKILDQVYNEIQTKKTEIAVDDKSLKLLEKVEKIVPRPPTPSIESPNEEDEERELAIILLQRIIRGRAIQNKMYEGKQMRADLISELRTTHALQEPEMKEIKKQDKEIKHEQRTIEHQHHTESVVIDGAERNVTELIGRQLDFLNKELVRLQEERRIHAYVMLAQRTRRIKEAEESGKRQREERIRRTEDEIFKQMMKVHQGTVDTYLEDVILLSTERTADEQSRDEIRMQAEAVNKVAFEFEKTRNELESKEMVAEMVYYFVLPEVEKQTIREKVKQSQRRHLLAAHRIVHKQTDELLVETKQDTNNDHSTTTDS